MVSASASWRPSFLGSTHMARAHVLGVPRIGPNRELKFAQEASWRDKKDEAALKAETSDNQQTNRQRQHAAGLDFVTTGDFAFYDQMLNQVALLGCAPVRFGFGVWFLFLVFFL